MNDEYIVIISKKITVIKQVRKVLLDPEGTLLLTYSTVITVSPACA